jgi:hypothetical protein
LSDDTERSSVKKPDAESPRSALSRAASSALPPTMETALVRLRLWAPAPAGTMSARAANKSARRGLRAAAAVLAMWGAGVAEARAQETRRELPVNVFVGTESENYLRYLQTLGVTPAFPWSARMFSSEALGRLAPLSDDHPWAARPMLQRRATKLGPASAELAPLKADLSYNTGFPFGYNDGAVWQGRGATIAVQGGGSLSWGPVDIVLAPTAFWAENRHFGLIRNDSAWGPWVDPLNVDVVDRPQRFGDKPYARLDPGQSTIRLSGFGVQAGASTANRWWGPMSEFPFVMGNNAPGLSHVFLGTSSPRKFFLGRFHTELIYARLTQSQYSPVRTGQTLRFGSGIVVVFEPRFMPGLEVGATRFFHAPWPDSGGPTTEYYTHLFETFIKRNINNPFLPRPDNNQSADNQLASVFARWVFPKGGMEVYAEFGREDHNWNARDLMVQPDHSASVGIGARKAFHNSMGIRAIRFESMNHQVGTIARHRLQGGAYHHGFTPQGHTERGQLIAAGIAAGGGAATSVTYEAFEGDGMTQWSWHRLVVRDRSIYGTPMAEAQHVVRVERERRSGPASVRAAVTVIGDFNRNLTSSDVLGLRFELGWRRF